MTLNRKFMLFITKNTTISTSIKITSFICLTSIILLLYLITENYYFQLTNNQQLMVFNYAYAHIPIGTTNSITKTVDNYDIVFLPYPSIPRPNDNSTLLNFNVQENGVDAYGMFVSLIIKEKESGKLISQIPYKFHAFGDITYRYAFKNSTDYTLLLQTRINGDPKYEKNPLEVSFDISVRNESENSNLTNIILYVPPIIVIIIIVYIFVKNKKLK